MKIIIEHEGEEIGDYEFTEERGLLIKQLCEELKENKEK